MNKKAFILFCTLALIVVGGLWIYCMPSLDEDAEPTPSIASVKPSDGMTLVNAYLTIINKVLEQDPSFNEHMTYLAIDSSMLTSLTKEEKQTLLSALDKYGFTVLDKTFEALKQEGYVKDLIFEQGLFLQIEEETVDSNKLIIYPSKWRSTTNHIGCSQMVLEMIDGDWYLTSEGSWWHM